MRKGDINAVCDRLATIKLVDSIKPPSESNQKGLLNNEKTFLCLNISRTPRRTKLETVYGGFDKNM